MSSKNLTIAALSILALTASFAPVTSGEVTADGVTFYLAPNSAAKGKLVLEPPTAAAADKVTRNGPVAQKTTHDWEAAPRPANLTVEGDATLTLFVEPGSTLVPAGNPPGQLPGSLHLKIAANFGGTAATVVWTTVENTAGAKEVTANLVFAGYPLTVAPDATLSITTEFYAAQATGAQVVYHVNATTALSRVDIPGSIEGLEPVPPTCPDGEVANETGVCVPIDVDGDLNATGNDTGNGTDNATGNDSGEPKVGVQGKDSDKKKKEGFLPGFEAILGAIGALGVALARRRYRRS